MDREANSEAYKPDLNRIGAVLAEKAESADAVIISDYGKGFVTNEMFALLRQSARFLSVDPKPRRLLDYSSPDILTPNRLEALALA